MDLQFGKQVYEQSQKLLEQGKDVNQIAKILCDQDKAGYNYGIGIILCGDGKPMPSSPTLLEYAAKELASSIKGDYMNSNKILDDLKKAVLSWQRVPEKYWKNFKIALPSDAGTGAVKTAVEVALMLHPALNSIGIEELGWPAYKAIAKTSRVKCQEFPADTVISGSDLLPVYQAGPMNTTGLVNSAQLIAERAQSAAMSNSLVVLDRAYSGFEFSRLVDSESYNDIMLKSYEMQIKPYLEQGLTFCMAISPTKCFVTFSLRPCGFLLLYCPDTSRDKETTNMLNLAVRARGSSFEHSITRAFVKALVNDFERLEQEHLASLMRLSNAETLWRKFVKGTPMEYLFSDSYAGLFRNPQARPDSAIKIYNEHLYPVFSGSRCRLNITGIPDNEDLAQKHVAVFAAQCF